MKRFIFFLFVLWVLSFTHFLIGELEKEEFNSAQQIEKDLLELINKERKEHAYLPLQLHPELNKVALRHSLKMAKERKLSHVFAGYRILQHRLMDTGLFFIDSGENIAFSESIMGKYIYREFMKSIGHRQNILNPEFTHCGIKLAPLKGDYYVTQVFARLYTPLKEKEMEKRLEKGLKNRFREAFNERLIFFTKLKPYARIASKLIAGGKRIDTFMESLPDQWGRIHAVSLVSHHVEKVETELYKVIMEKKYSGAAIGVSITRNMEFPGSAYSVSVFLLDFAHGKWTGEEFAQLLLEEINRERGKNRLDPLEWDKRISHAAITMIEKEFAPGHRRFQPYIKKALRRIGRSQARLFTFTAVDPRGIPANVHEALMENGKTLKKIGILVHLPIKHDLPSVYFQVTLIL